jgi:hypothetical protein
MMQPALLHMCRLQVCLLAWMVLMLMWHASLAQSSLHLLLLLQHLLLLLQVLLRRHLLLLLLLL